MNRENPFDGVKGVFRRLGLGACLLMNGGAGMAQEPQAFLRSSLTKLNPRLAREQSVGVRDYAGWTISSGVAIGSYDPHWVVAYDLQK